MRQDDGGDQHMTDDSAMTHADDEGMDLGMEDGGGAPPDFGASFDDDDSDGGGPGADTLLTHLSSSGQPACIGSEACTTCRGDDKAEFSSLM